MPTSVTTYSDAFTGDGSLNGHASDASMGTWGTSPIGGTDLTISSGAVAIPSTAGIGDTYGNATTTSLSFSTGTVVVCSDLTFPATSPGDVAPATVFFGPLSGGARGNYDVYLFYSDPNWSCYMGAWETASLVTVSYASMPLDTAGARFGVQFKPDGVARVFTEPLGGGTRTYRGNGSYATASAVSLQPYLGVFVMGTPGAGGKIDNYAISLEVETSVATARIAPARSRATLTEVDGAVSAWTTTPMDSNTSDVALSTTTYDNRATGWLTASLNTAVAPAVLTLTAAIGNLPVDNYTATLALTSSAATNSPYALPVTFVPAWQTEHGSSLTWTPLS